MPDSTRKKATTTLKSATSTKKAATTTKRAATTTTRAQATDLIGLNLSTWVSGARKAKGAEARSGARGFLFFFPHKDQKIIKSALSDHLSKWQMNLLLESEAETVHYQGSQGPVWIFRGSSQTERENLRFVNSLEKSVYAKVRDFAGSAVAQLSQFSLDKLILVFAGLGIEDQKAALVGLEMASYSFAENRPDSPKARKKLPMLLWTTFDAAKSKAVAVTPQLTEDDVNSSALLARSVNIARHFVNLPGGTLNPRTFAESIDELFTGSRSSEVEIWAGNRLVEERMNLLLAVGGAAAEGPRLVHIRYRPAGVAADRKPIAIVGKGITFDSGGLDIKPSSGMRWMKKDMGGAAATIALAKWADAVQLPLPLDFYVSLAENAVGPNSFRPGDVITSRAGITVEIQNTDAEGRLVLADALDVAVNQEGEDAPEAVINLATLTGAIKVSLGTEVAGLFSNSDSLAQGLQESGIARGDLSWRMPLFQPYKASLRSTFADYANSADGFGGAVTAALFLELFVKGKPWAHLDIYAWRDSGSGAWAESGGNGQPVQALAEYLIRLAAT